MKRQEIAPQSYALDVTSIVKRNEEAGSSLPKTSAEMSDIEESPKSDHSGEELSCAPQYSSPHLFTCACHIGVEPFGSQDSVNVTCAAVELPPTIEHEETAVGPQVSLDIYELPKPLNDEKDKLPSFSDTCCIYRVPIRVRESNEKIFTPRVVSLGPLHHGKEELKAMEKHKRSYLNIFLEWSKASSEKLTEVVNKNVPILRKCYAETSDLGDKKFGKMMLRDASFIIVVLLRGCGEAKFRSREDRIFNNPTMLDDIMLDMCLLENQLPFFILEDLFRESGISISNLAEYPVTKLTCKFFKEIWLTSWVTEWENIEIKSEGKKNKFKTIAHIVDLIRKCQKPTEAKKKKANNIEGPSVTELYQAGVKFEPKEAKSLLDMKFDKGGGVLKIPTLRIDDRTEILIRNLQAFEQCYCDGNYIGDYISMINFLVITSNDVEILVRNKIIENWIHDNEAVTTLLHNVSKGNKLSPVNFFFDSLVQDLKEHYERTWNKSKANLKQQYFHTPWAVISFIAGVTLLILTAIQTICSIISV